MYTTTIRCKVGHLYVKHHLQIHAYNIYIYIYILYIILYILYYIILYYIISEIIHHQLIFIEARQEYFLKINAFRL